MRKTWLVSAFFILCGNLVFSNNFQVTNIVESPTQVSFDISWNNSWNIATAPNNWDAVWVFVKYQDCNSSDKNWNHLILSSNSADHSVSAGVLQVDAATDGMGVFVRRSGTGTGNISVHTVTLKFASALPTISNVNFEVGGIEMVYVPAGAFYAGDGGATAASQNTFGNNNTSTYRQVTSEAALAADAFRHPNMGAPTQHLAIPDAFPKGYAAFYCMKYEISQKQYIQFLNLLGPAQQASRTSVSPASAANTLALAPSGSQNRNGIKIKIPASGTPLGPAVYGSDLSNNNVYDEAADGASIACNYLQWSDLLAYLDWAALRPMTELEFEKAARGPETPVATAFVWNTTAVTQAISTSLTNGGQSSEVSTASGNGLCAYGAASTSGPLRVGFAATASTGRVGAGASYYGILDLSGNVWEQAYHIGHSAGSGNGAPPIFTGVLGDGQLDGFGYANAANWSPSDDGVSRSTVRGGNWNQTNDYCRLSNRNFVTQGSAGANATRTAQTGGRGVRQ